MHRNGENTKMTQAEKCVICSVIMEEFAAVVLQPNAVVRDHTGMSRASPPAGCPLLAHTHTATCVGMLVVDQGKMPAVHV